jgi:hypothetical protein
MTVYSVRAVVMAAIFTLLPLNAAAKVHHVTYSGMITDGFDNDNIFGLSGHSLVGRTMMADVTYSTSVPGTRTTDANSDEISGGFNFGLGSVISSAAFTIGSTSFAFSPIYYSDVYTSVGFMDAYGYDLSGNQFQTYIVPDNAGSVNLQTPFFSTGVGDTGGRYSQYSYLSTGNDLIDFNATSVLVAAVPEPATWALMILGFGGVGCAMRRHKVRKVPSNA